MAEFDGVSLDELRAQCQALEPVVLRAQLATVEELASHKPGGTANPQEGARGWLRYLIVLQRRHARQENGTSGSATAGLDARLLQTQAGEPHFLTLSERGEDGRHRRLAVHPKSLRANIELHKIDKSLVYLGGYAELLRADRMDAPTLALYQRTVDAIAYYTGLIIWALDHPGPRLPWDRAIPEPELPEQYLDLTPIDVFRLAALHQRVNNGDLQALSSMISASGGQTKATRPTFSIFMGSTALEFGVKPEELAEEWSLGAVFAAVHLAAIARQDSAQRAADAAEARAL